jgi:hypothetical protein
MSEGKPSAKSGRCGREVTSNLHREIVARNVGFDDVGREIAGLPKDGENFLVILRDF